MKKQNLNEEVSRIKGMMGLNEGQKHSYTENFGGNFSKEDDPIVSDDIEWDYPSDRNLDKARQGGYDSIAVYGYGTMNHRTIHYKGIADIHSDGEVDLENITDIEIDDSWEPSDDQIMNQGNYEGGISYGSGDSWQGR
jgi:hypothetical protein